MKRLFAAFAPLLLAASAFAAEVQRTFEIEVTGPESAAVTRAVLETADRGVAAPYASEWDAAKLGPFDIVARRAKVSTGISVLESGATLVSFTVRLDDANLPSGLDAVNAYAARIATTVEKTAGETIEKLAAGARARLDAPIVATRSQRLAHEAELRALEDVTAGPPSLRLDSVTERLLAAEREAATLRIDRTVVAKKLEAVRAAAQRAVELGRMRDQADAIERRIDETRTAPEREQLKAQLAELRRRIADGSAKCPSLETARERVFELEVELVGLETREAAVAEELKALRAAVPGLTKQVRQCADVTARIDELKTRERDFATHAEDELRSTPRTTARLIAPPRAPK